MSKQYNEKTQARPSLEERLGRLKKGLVSDRRVLDDRLDRMRHFPLIQWFGAHPERLEQLCRAFPAITKDMTFGKAASALWKDRKTDQWQQWQDNMWLLLSPLLDIDKYMIKLNDGGAFYWGAR